MTAPDLPLLDRAGPATEPGYCADCLKHGARCPDHRHDPETRGTT